jgi:alpha-tubulin suppressor-like RCC1 family protein
VLKLLSETQKLIQIACAKNHTLAVSSTGQVYAWGAAKYGVLGLSSAAAADTYYAASVNVHNDNEYPENHYYADPEHGELFQYEPKLVSGLKGKNVVQVACRSWHNIACTSCGEIYSWGFAR